MCTRVKQLGQQSLSFPEEERGERRDKGSRRVDQKEVGDPNSNRLLGESNFLARFEPNGFSGRNGDLVACPWISADSTLSGLDYKNPKPSKFYALAFLHGLLESAEN